MRATSLLLPFLALCIGCGGPPSGGTAVAAPTEIRTAKPTVVIALDTSTSAKEFHEVLYNQIINQMESLPRDRHLIVYRFDSSPAEIHDGPAITDGAEAGKKLKPELQWESKSSGTNLCKLFERMDKRIKPKDGTVDIDVYTDCGTEEMTPQECERCRQITKEWNRSGSLRLRFHGVRTGFKEKIRDLVSFDVDID